MVRIRFQSIHIDSVANTSGINKGENRIIGRKHAIKSNDGLGEVSGDGNVVTGGNHLVLDSDTIDVPTPKRKG